ncbi:MAG TPA: hypothetical protein PKZ84_14795 [Anaerolineae bacterium]|nr:hypothetical protein [Anaerolineae bacterium]HQI84645.1 hypothetical protein [Anaerolineae bacterium]
MTETPNSATENVIAAMTERIVQQFDPLRIILSGSQARGYDAGCNMLGSAFTLIYPVQNIT